VNALVLEWAADHPASEGHFPGSPIIPGALLLAEALRLAGAASAQDPTRWRVASAKFPSPCRPGDTVELTFSARAHGATLIGSVAGRTVLKVDVTCAAISIRN